MIKNKNIEQLISKFRENRLSHIYLIETNDKNQLMQDLLELVKIINCPEIYQENCQKCNLCHLVDNHILPSLILIYPDGQAIKKEQIEDLKQEFAHKPYIAKFNIYIINEAEKLNVASANTMLKFIEEPEPNTIGFLITNNKENVISTIKSRCDYLKSYYDMPKETWSEELEQLAISYLYDVEIVKTKSIFVNKKIVDKKLERDQIKELFQIILTVYLNLLDGKLNYEHLKDMQKLNTKDIIKRIYLVNEILEKINYNVNINLLLDDFVLRVEE